MLQHLCAVVVLLLLYLLTHLCCSSYCRSWPILVGKNTHVAVHLQAHDILLLTYSSPNLLQYMIACLAVCCKEGAC